MQWVLRARKDRSTVARFEGHGRLPKSCSRREKSIRFARLGRKRRANALAGLASLQCVEPLRSIDVTSSWGRGEREKSTSPHKWTNNSPPWQEAAAIQYTKKKHTRTRARARTREKYTIAFFCSNWIVKTMVMGSIVPLWAYWSPGDWTHARHIPSLRERARCPSYTVFTALIYRKARRKPSRMFRSTLRL